MRIGDYIKDYTDGNPVSFRYVTIEVGELVSEIARMKIESIKDEFGDVFHFIQLWIYWRFGINGEIWGMTRKSVDKFIKRKSVWNRIYVFVGLSENISGYAGNYHKIDKVINHLAKFGVNREKAEAAYNQIVTGKVSEELPRNNHG